MKAFLLLILMTSFAFGMGARRPAPVPPIPSPSKPAEVIVLDPVEVTTPGKTKVFLKVKGTAAQIARITRLKDSVERIINSREFKSRVLGAYYKGKLQFVDTNLSNAQVLETLRGNDWDLQVGIERASCSTLGWTYPNVKMFWFNSCTFDSREDSGIVGTICHEYSHKLKFEHSKYNNSARPYSVPYGVGTICAELYPLFK